jgi:hypothetical protein
MPMEENPYAPPRASDRIVGVKSGRREDLKAVAVAQKSILVCILLYFVAIISQFLVPVEYRLYVLFGVLVIGLVATVSVFLLAIRVYSTAMGIALGIGTFIPCLGLVILLMINGKATAILKQNGHHVGLLGANLSQF